MAKYTIKVEIDAVNDIAAHAMACELAGFVQENDFIDETGLVCTRDTLTEIDFAQDVEIAKAFESPISTNIPD